MRKIALSIITLLIGIEALAQFEVDAQLRNRFELRNGYQKVAEEGLVPAAFVSQRTRVSFAYRSENFKLKFTPQDVRIWGDEKNATLAGVTGDDAALDMFEGYAEIKVGEDNWVSVGRQQLVYDNQWLLSARNWNQNGISNDAVVLKLKQNDYNIHIGSIWNTLKEASSNNLFPTDRYKTLNYLWVNKIFSESLKVSFLHLTTGITETDTTNKINFRHTSGFYGEMKFSNLSIVANTYYQYGRNQVGKPVNALLAFLDISYKIDPMNFGLGANYLSGNNKIGSEQTVDRLFDPIYSARHRYFGFMDYFRSFSSHTKQGGLADYFFYLDYKFSKSVSIRNTGHYFQLAQTNPTTPTDKNLGYENDLVLKYIFNDWGALEGGYMFFLPTESLKTIQGVANDKFSQFFYLQLTLTPTLFKQQATQ